MEITMPTPALALPARPLWLAGQLPTDAEERRYAVFDDLNGSAVVAETGYGPAARLRAVTIAAEAGAVTELRRALHIFQHGHDAAEVATFIENARIILARLGELP